jgi:putative zinc finger/helix-turn-helix YgiT family protein
MKTEQCSNCENEAQVISGNYRFNEVGLPVLLKNVELIKCDECGTIEPVIPNLDGLMHAIALAIITHECSLRGDEIRFLRKYLGLSSAEFIQLLHVDKSTLSRWENGEEIGPQSDRLIRLLVLNKSEELRQHIEKMMKMFPGIADAKPAGRKPQLQVDPATLEYEYA